MPLASPSSQGTLEILQRTELHCFLQTLQNACASTGLLELAEGERDTMLTLLFGEVETARSEITRLLSTIGCFHDNPSKLVAHFSNTGAAEDISVSLTDNKR